MNVVELSLNKDCFLKIDFQTQLENKLKELTKF